LSPNLFIFISIFFLSFSSPCPFACAIFFCQRKKNTYNKHDSSKINHDNYWVVIYLFDSYKFTMTYTNDEYDELEENVEKIRQS